MRHPVLRDRLFQRFRGGIMSGAYEPGHKFSTEPELALELGVSRKALRSAFAMLESERLIERRPREGTFVTRWPKTESPSIYFLLPCANLELTGRVPSTNINESMGATLQAAVEQGAQMVTIPVSRSNRIDDIDWKTLEMIEPGGRVFVNSSWFAPLFGFLNERGCRVALAHSLDLAKTCFEKPSRSWHKAHLRHDWGAREAVVRLARRGCRRIAMVEYDTNTPGNLMRQGYLDGLTEAGLPATEELLVVPPRVPPDMPALIRQFQDIHKRLRYDGLITLPITDFKLDYRHSINRNLRLPENVRVLTHYRFDFNELLHPQVPCWAYDYRRICSEATAALLAPPSIPLVEIDYPPVFYYEQGGACPQSNWRSSIETSAARMSGEQSASH